MSTKSWASSRSDEMTAAGRREATRYRDSLPTDKRQCPKCGDRHLLSERELHDWLLALPAPVSHIPSAPRGECRKIEFPEGVTVIDTMVFNGRLIAATDAGVFEVINGAPVLLKPELPA